MGRVWRAQDRRRGSRVAVKVISAVRASDEGYRERFRREVQSHARLRHPGVASVYDFGEVGPHDAADSQGELALRAPYLALEFAEEGTLVDGGAPTSWRQLRAMLVQLLDALAYAHARDVVHRDLKPSNVLVFGEPGDRRFKLVDFGVAYSLSQLRNRGVTELELTVGTPEYMAPEQFESAWRDFGPWTDLYSMGCIAYEIACGAPPFEGDSVEAIARGHLQQGLPRIDPTFAVPGEFLRWLRRMTARERRMRFCRAADAARALASLPEVDPEATAWGLQESTSTVDLEGGAARDAPAPDSEVVEPRSSPPKRRDSKSMVPPPADPISTDSSAPESAEERRDPVGGGLDGGSTVTPTRPFSAATERASEASLPEDWTVEDTRYAAKEELETGWGLYGLRELPFVDREAERDAIWQSFRAVVEEAGPTGVVIEGRSGRGKSRLAEWMVRRAHEVGGLRIARGAYGRQGGYRQGLAEVLDRTMRLWDLEGEDLVERARSVLERWYPRDRGDAYLEREARAVAHFVDPRSTGSSSSGYYFEDAEEAYELLGRLFQAYARERPVAVWLDDVQWGSRALDFATHFLEGDEAGRVCLILTARTESLEQQPMMRERLDALAGQSRVTSLELGALDDVDHAELLRRLLPLEDQLVDEMARRTAGNPLFAVQLVGDLVDRGELEERGNRLALVDEEHDALKQHLPGHLSELWQRRVERVARVAAESDAGPVDSEDAERAIELAAAFGEQVDATEWRRACNLADVSIPRLLVDELIVRGLARRDPNGWRFAHAMLVDAIEAKASDAGRARRAHRICAEVIESLYGSDRRETLSRRAEHLIGAADWEEALDPLRRAAKMSWRAGRYRRCRQLLGERSEVLERLGLAEESDERVHDWLLEARVRAVEGDRAEAERLGRRAREVAARRGWPKLEAEAVEFQAFLRKLEGRIDKCMQLAEQAREIYEALEVPGRWAKCEMIRAHAHQCRSEHTRAREALENARAIFRRHDHVHRELQATKHLVYCLIYEERYDDARRRAHRLRERAESEGNAAVEAHGWNQLGEIARFRKRWARAREYYQTAAEIWGRTGSEDVKVVELNLGLVELGAGAVRRAAAIFERLAPEFRDRGWRRLLPTAQLALAVCRSRRSEWSALEEQLERSRTSLDEVDNRERDHGWLADELLEQLPPPEGEAGRRREVLKVAERIYRDLGDAERVERVRERRTRDSGGD